ncbi:hypothetical protein BCR35DRAFT_326470 [Leucosporidium creatinivorum]|uniref:Uncharacterized protein n=1 Tax=Leucosporidium creatinivorum TaxID=106004 RepID=A0A1Y2E926_9BASI|nr:hypothetical protein BCR35DRAFT_326470 [Leucosporidium creatinivorum]
MPPPPPSPSRRVSDLVALFQQPSAPTSPTAPNAPSFAGASGSSINPTVPGRASATRPPQPATSPSAPSRIVPVRSGTVGQHVRRFAQETGKERAREEKELARDEAPSAIQKGSVGAMDWAPRSSPRSSPKTPNQSASAPPTPPSPATKPSSPVVRPQQKTQLSSFQPKRPAPSPPSAAVRPAPTVLIPATVSNDGQHGKLKSEMANTKPKTELQGGKGAKMYTRAGVASREEAKSAPAQAVSPTGAASAKPKRKPPPPLLEPLSLPSSSAVLSPKVDSPLASTSTSPPTSAKSPFASPSQSSTPSPFVALGTSQLADTHPLLAAPTPAPLTPSLPNPSPPIPSPRPRFDHSKTSSSAAPLLSPRPRLTHLSSSRTTASACQSTATQHLPAAKLFAAGADPLVLPAVDQVLRVLGGAARFSQVDSPKLRWGQEEKRGWEEWVREGDKAGWWTRFTRAIGLGKSGGSRGSYDDLEKDHPELGGDEERERAQIFPPMHLLPPKMTVTDLKRNQLTPMAIVSLAAVVQNAANGVLAAAGSTYGVNLTTVEMFRDLMQMITLLTSSSSSSSSSTWYRAIFYTFPSAISLDFVSAFGMAILWLWVFTAIAAVVVYELFRFTGGWKGAAQKKRDEGEGFDREGVGKLKKHWWQGWRDSYGYKVTITFLATSFYLPLSKLAIGALFWTSDYWPVDNPYLSTDNPSPAPLGPSSTYYDPLSFCYRTTMLRPVNVFHNFNWAYLILPVAAFTLVWLTFFLPWRLYWLAKKEAPVVDPWTEMGEKRKDMNAEYQKLVNVDRSPFSFLYREYRRPWASFKALYMLIKLVNVLLIVIIQKNNCAFRSYSSIYLGVVRQGSLVAFMSLFLLSMRASKPFADVISNTSDMVSRIGYVVIAVIGLLVALDVKGEEALGGPVLILVNVVVYSMNGYFALIGTDVAQRVVKRLQRRLDTSIDLFSPHLDLPKHLSRRIWHETFSTILLAGPEYKMPAEERLQFSVDPYLPPYLLGFRGTAGERHVENLKILREIGLDAYAAAMQARDLDPESNLHRLRRTLQHHFTGPDVYWRPHHQSAPSTVSSFFGRLDIIPFPFVAVFRWDQDPLHPIQITEMDDLQHLVKQNESTEVQSRKRVRIALRALEGQAVFAPHVETKGVGKRHGVEVQSRIQYRIGTISIRRNSELTWNGYNFASGFEVSISYVDGQSQDSDGGIRYGQHLTLDAAGMGITDDFSLCTSVAKLFRRNKDLVDARMPLLESTLARHRDFFRAEAEAKHRALSHSFLFDVVADDTLSVVQLEKVLAEREKSSVVREMVQRYGASLTFLEERMAAVRSSRVRAWWYLLWDDLWRKNTNVSRILSQPASFSPHYRQSICYHPMPRADLERFLNDRGFPTTTRGYFNTGLLNKIYFYLDEIIFPGTDEAIPIHFVDKHDAIVPFSSLDTLLPPRHLHPLDASHYTNTTGAGTDHDDDHLQPRAAFPFESIYDEPNVKLSAGFKAWSRDWVTRRGPQGVTKWLGLVHTIHERRVEEQDEVVFDLKHGRAGWELSSPKDGRKGEE